MGIDPSLCSTGIICLDKNGNIAGCRLIKTDSNSGDECRLIYIWDSVKNFLDKYKSEDVVIYIEGLSYGSKTNPVIKAKLSGLHYYIRVCLKELGKSFEIIPPKTLKKLITGNGNAGKDDIGKRLQEELNIDLNNDNLSDAYSLARVAFDNSKDDEE